MSLEGVQPLRARARRAADRGGDQAGAGPVVELPVGDADDLARGGAAETHELIGQPVQPGPDEGIREELALLGRGRRLVHRAPFPSNHSLVLRP